MPTIHTMNSVSQVSTEDFLDLVVPLRYSRARIIPTKNKKKYQVQFWCTKENRVRGVSFLSLDDAEKFFKQVCHSSDVIRRVTLSQVLTDIPYFQKFYRLSPKQVEYPTTEIPLDPYFLGLWLGDGTSVACSVATADQEIIDYLENTAESIGFRLVHQGRCLYNIRPKENDIANMMTLDKSMMDQALLELDKGATMDGLIKKYKTSRVALHKFRSLRDNGEYDEYFARRKINPITSALKELKVWGNKHIPELYLKNSRDVRMKVLAGIIDSDGHLSSGGYNMAFANRRLLEDVVALARSLGFICCDIVDYESCCNGKKYPAYRSRICGGPELCDIPVLLGRKKVVDKRLRRDQLAFTISL